MDRFGEGPYVAPVERKPWSKRKIVTVALLTMSVVVLVVAPMWTKLVGDWKIGNYYRRCVMHNADACENWPPPRGFGPAHYGPGRLPIIVEPWSTPNSQSSAPTPRQR